MLHYYYNTETFSPLFKGVAVVLSYIQFGLKSEELGDSGDIPKKAIEKLYISGQFKSYNNSSALESALRIN
ncbi:hypothetical protein D5086_026069 [Populus alba]|uniref:Uncharacterized protein n=1 Tax=Populus alba TaxID=43335 RepID=A0ACC4B0Z9_POPAL